MDNENDFTQIEKITQIKFDDWVIEFLVKDQHNLTAVLHHAQIVLVENNKIIEEIQPKFWKIAVSAKILENGSVLIGDSFGTISCYNTASKLYFESNLDKGTIFDIDFHKNTQTILTVQEFHTVAMWRLHDDHFELLMNCQPHSSRVLHCCFVHNKIPVSLGEDGFMVVFDLDSIAVFR